MRRNLIFDDISSIRTGREHISEASLRSSVKRTFSAVFLLRILREIAVEAEIQSA
jgi:hypothetical protein